MGASPRTQREVGPIPAPVARLRPGFGEPEGPGPRLARRCRGSRRSNHGRGSSAARRSPARGSRDVGCGPLPRDVEPLRRSTADDGEPRSGRVRHARRLPARLPCADRSGRWHREYRPASGDHPSQGYRFAEDRLFDMRAETVLRHDVNPAVQKMLEVDEELGKIEKAPAAFQVDKEVHVTVGSGLPTYHGSEDTHIRRAMECARSRGSRLDEPLVPCRCSWHISFPKADRCPGLMAEGPRPEWRSQGAPGESPSRPGVALPPKRSASHRPRADQPPALGTPPGHCRPG